MTKGFDEVVNEDGERGYFIPLTADVTIKDRKAREQAQYFAAKSSTRFNHGRKYFVSYNEAVAEVIRDMSLIEAGALIKMLLTLNINEGGRLKDADKPLTKVGMARLLGRSRPATDAIIARLTDIGVLSFDGTYYVIDDRYHTVGAIRTQALFTKIYTVRARSIIASLKLSEIGLLYKIIPFFHFSEYYLCVDANANVELIDYLGREGLAAEINHAPETVSRLIAKLQSAGVILRTGTRNESRYLVHPDFMFRQAEGTETDWTWAVRKLFDDHAKKSRR